MENRLRNGSSLSLKMRLMDVLTVLIRLLSTKRLAFANLVTLWVIIGAETSKLIAKQALAIESLFFYSKDTGRKEPETMYHEMYDEQYEREYAWERMNDMDNDEWKDMDNDDPDLQFADPGGNSALRAATPDNPRIHPCPNCRFPNRLTARDVAHGYQCDSCANALERGIDPPYNEDYDDGLEDEPGDVTQEELIINDEYDADDSGDDDE